MKMKFIGQQVGDVYKGSYPEFLILGEKYECYEIEGKFINFYHPSVGVVSPLNGGIYLANKNAFREVVNFDDLRAAAAADYDAVCVEANTLLADARDKRRRAMSEINKLERESNE